MNKVLVAIGVAFVTMLPLSASGATKYLECTQTGAQGKVLNIHATISDSSDQAEVQLYYAGASCETDKTCEKERGQVHLRPFEYRKGTNVAS